MASEQMMSEEIARTVAETTRVVLQIMAEAWAERTQNAAGSKLGGPTMKQPTLNREAPDNYSELKIFRLGMNNVLSTHNMPEAEKIAVVKNWLGRKCLHYLETLTTEEREACNMLEGLFEMLDNKFKPQYNETIKSLQFRKLYQFKNKSIEEWMGRLHIAVVECNYQEVNRQLKEQFIHRLNDKYMLEEIIKELTTTKDDDHITSGVVLAWAKQVEAQRAQAAVLNTITELRQFNKVKIAKKLKEDNTRGPLGPTLQQ